MGSPDSARNQALPTQRIDPVLLTYMTYVITAHMHGLFQVIWYNPETQKPFTVCQNEQSVNKG